uniref:KIB1-4 beta-propeller domain-containing protein n=1 Tax=Leersia perrieri TaxID=77586 RepID=A0A0D9WXU9_9ORYZ
MYQPEDVSLPDFLSKRWILNLNETEEENEVETQTFISPFEGIHLKISSPILDGKQCLRCIADWLLLFDEVTKECYLTNIISHSKVHLPPLLEPLDNLGRYALSSPTTLPDSTIMFACSNFDKFVLYCRPGDKEWTKYYVDFQGIDDYFLGTIFGGNGRMYVETNWKNSCVVIHTSSSSIYVEKTGIAEPKTCPLHKPYTSCWVESNGDVFLVRLYCHSYHSSGVVNIDVHRMNTLKYVWERVDGIGDATFFLGINSVGLSSTYAGTQPNCIHFLLSCCDGIRLYTIKLDAQTISFTLLPGCANPDDSSYIAYWFNYWYGLYWAIPRSSKHQPSNSLDVITNKFNRILLSKEGTEQANEAQWSNIPIELLELLVPKLSFIDYFHVQATCKEWSLMTKPIQYTKTYTMLVSF